MLKKIILLMILLLNLLTTVQMSNNIYAQSIAEEDECHCYTDLMDNGEDREDPKSWVELDALVAQIQESMDAAERQEQLEWIQEMNQWSTDQSAEIDEIMREYLEEWVDKASSGDDWEHSDLFNEPYTTPEQKTPLCFICYSNNKDKKYYNSAQISVVAKPNKMDTLLVIDENNIIAPQQFTWEKDNVTKCSNDAKCLFSSSIPGTYKISVKGPTGKKLIEITLVVYGKSIIKFSKKDKYKGQYGFDSEGYQYESLKNHYQKLIVDGKFYTVPWISLLNSQSDTIKIDPLLTSADASNTTYFVTFKSSKPAFIKINGWDSLRVTGGAAINNLKSIKVTSIQWDTALSHYSIGDIFVLNNIGDTIGKLNISCHKPISKKIVFVYVNTGKGYRDTMLNNKITKDSLLYYLDTVSYNQIFKKWELQTQFPDKLNIQTAYLANPRNFIDITGAHPTLIVDTLNKYYKIQNGLDVQFGVNGNGIFGGGQLPVVDPRRTYFFYITDIGNIGGGSGVVRDIGAESACISFWGNQVEIIHEIGHLLNLLHTFQNFPTGSAFIPNINPTRKGVTNNFMDYSKIVNMFFYYQWHYSY